MGQLYEKDPNHLFPSLQVDFSKSPVLSLVKFHFLFWLYSLQCELDRDLFGQRTSCQAFTVTVIIGFVNINISNHEKPRDNGYGDFIQRYPGFCTMGYISPALPPDFGRGMLMSTMLKQPFEVQLTEIDDDERRTILRINHITPTSTTAAKAGSEINILYNAKSILTDNSI